MHAMALIEVTPDWHSDYVTAWDICILGSIHLTLTQFMLMGKRRGLMWRFIRHPDNSKGLSVSICLNSCDMMFATPDQPVGIMLRSHGVELPCLMGIFSYKEVGIHTFYYISFNLSQENQSQLTLEVKVNFDITQGLSFSGEVYQPQLQTLLNNRGLWLQRLPAPC
jgi:hypothetical protein